MGCRAGLTTRLQALWTSVHFLPARALVYVTNRNLDFVKFSFNCSLYTDCSNMVYMSLDKLSIKEHRRKDRAMLPKY